MLKNASLLLIFNYAIWYLDKLMRNSSVFYTVEINKQSKMAAAPGALPNEQEEEDAAELLFPKGSLYQSIINLCCY